MRLLLRPRIVAVLALASVVGPLLAPGAASAAPPTVTFTGGCGLLGVGASSQPSTGSVRIATNSSVNFVNHLNGAAQLLVNGASQTTIKPDYQVQVSFHASATVALVPSCLLGSGGAGTVSIRVSESPGGGGTPTGSATAGTPTQAGTPSGKPSAAGTPSAGQPSASPSGTASRTASTPGTGRTSAAAALAPTTGASGPPPAVAAIGAASPAASGHHGPDRLLAVIAAVCVIGVSIALIRAIVAQRAIRMVTA
jgi:hypothetical protein